MVSTFDPRHNARIICLQRLYEQDFKSAYEPSQIESFELETLKEQSEIKSYSVDLCEKILDAISTHASEIDNLIQKFADERPIDQMNRIDINIMRIALAEGLFLKVNSVKVCLDEAIELAREFGGIEEGKFVNGVLDRIFKEKFIAHQ